MGSAKNKKKGNAPEQNQAVTKKTEAKLFNSQYENNEEYENSSTYYTVLMEQWKTANEMANEISNRRSAMNSFYTSLLSVLVSAAVAANGIEFYGPIVFLCASILGLVFCKAWKASIASYKLLNKAKYEVINALEEKLSANVMSYEWAGIIGNKDRTDFKNYGELSKGETKIVKIFTIIFCITLVASLVLVFFAVRGKILGI